MIAGRLQRTYLASQTILQFQRLTARPNTRMQSDRFARKIVAFLAFSYAARSRRLMRNSLGLLDYR